MTTARSNLFGGGFLFIILSSAASVVAQNASRVEVTLREYKIDIPPVLPAGRVTFVVSNQGREDHGLVMEGNSIIRRLARGLRPGQTTTARVLIHPGTYSVYCPLGDNAKRGMQTQVLVRRSQD